jgi:hypothetical protein
LKAVLTETDTLMSVIDNISMKATAHITSFLNGSSTPPLDANTISRFGVALEDVLTAELGGEGVSLNCKDFSGSEPNVFLLIGESQSGKSCSAAKLASLLIRQSYASRVLIVPSAADSKEEIERVLAGFSAPISIFPSIFSGNFTFLKDSIKHLMHKAKVEKFDTVIVEAPPLTALIAMDAPGGISTPLAPVEAAEVLTCVTEANIEPGSEQGLRLDRMQQGELSSLQLLKEVLNPDETLLVSKVCNMNITMMEHMVQIKRFDEPVMKF